MVGHLNFLKMKFNIQFFTKADSLSSPRLAGRSRFYQTIGYWAKFIPSTCLPIGQTLAFNFLKSVHRAFAVCHVPTIMAMVKLRKVKRQMLFADMMKSPASSAFLKRAN